MKIAKYRLLISLFLVSTYILITYDCIASEGNISKTDSLTSSLEKSKTTSQKNKKENTPQLIINTIENKKSSQNTVFKCWLCCCGGCEVQR